MSSSVCVSLAECFNRLLGEGCIPLELTAAAAYVKVSGVEELERLLKLDESPVRLKIITGLDFYLTEPEAIKKLLNMGAEVLIYTGNREFHPKVYLIKCSNGMNAVIVGSSNLSRGALTGENIEFNLAMLDDNVSRYVAEFIEKLKAHSMEATNILEQYEQRFEQANMQYRNHKVSVEESGLALPRTSEAFMIITKAKSSQKSQQADISSSKERCTVTEEMQFTTMTNEPQLPTTETPVILPKQQDFIHTKVKQPEVMQQAQPHIISAKNKLFTKRLEVLIPEYLCPDVCRNREISKKFRHTCIEGHRPFKNLLGILREKLHGFLTNNPQLLKERTENYAVAEVKLSKLMKLLRHTNLRALEELLYLLSHCHIITLRYIGGYDKKTRPGPKKLWSHFNMSGSRREIAEKMVFYMFTAHSKRLRSKRRRYWYDYIVVLIPVRIVKGVDSEAEARS